MSYLFSSCATVYGLFIDVVKEVVWIVLKSRIVTSVRGCPTARLSFPTSFFFLFREKGNRRARMMK